MKARLGWIIAVSAAVVGVIVMSQQTEERANERQAQAAASERARVAALTPEQKKREADRKVQQEVERKQQDAAVTRAAVGARLLKKAMNNPEKFQLESALVIDKTGAVCYEYLGQNAFGAIVKGKAALSRDAKRFLTNTDDGFTRLWNSECGGKAGQEVASAIRWFAL